VTLTMLRTLGIALSGRGQPPAPDPGGCSCRLLGPPDRVRDVADRGQQGRVGHRTAEPKRHDREAPCP
jgi:hypothetical protein